MTVFVVELVLVNQSSLGEVFEMRTVEAETIDGVAIVDFGSSGGLSDFECRDLDDSGGGSKLYV